MSEGRYVLIEDVIAAHITDLFVGMDIVHVSAFRVTRNADLTLDDEDADDLLVAVEMELRRRRFGRAVRLEVDHHINPDVLDNGAQQLARGLPDIKEHGLHLGPAPIIQIYHVSKRNSDNRLV
jgi:polyphosphate kinase